MNTQLDKPIELGSLYSLNEIIGLGATGVVYRGVNKETGTPIAAKILHPHHIKDPDILNQFLQEKTLLTSLDHSAIVTVKDLVAEASTLAIITELVDGYSLREYLKTQTNLTPHNATLIATRVLAALEHAHETGITHRDIKPDNILLARTWENGDANGVKLADFGISTIIARPTDTTAPSGTPAYMPPELWTQHIYNQPGDIYETGVTLYEMLAGHPPFPISDAAHHHENSTPPQLDIPTPLWHVLATMLAKNPEQRPTASQARTQLESILPSLEGLPALPPTEQPENYTPVTVVKTPTKKPTSDTATTQGKTASGIPAFNFAQFDQGGPATKLHAVPHRTNDSNLNTQEEEPNQKKKKALLILAASLAAIALLGGTGFIGFHFLTHNAVHAAPNGKASVSPAQGDVSGDAKADSVSVENGTNMAAGDGGIAPLNLDNLGGDSSGSNYVPPANSNEKDTDSQGGGTNGSGNANNPPAAKSPPVATINPVSIYRLYNKASGEHFLTADANEKNALTKKGFTYEGIAWKAPQNTGEPVYRLYNKASGEHIFTVNSNEKNTLVKRGWTYEKIAFYSANWGNNIPVYRLHNPQSGLHHWTTDVNEVNSATRSGWKNEGTAFYAMR